MGTSGGSRGTKGRRTCLRIAVVLSLSAAMVPAMEAVSVAWVPRTMHRVVGWGGDTVRTGLAERTLPFPATELGVTWQGSSDPPLVRTSTDGENWSGWKRPEESEDMFDPATGTHFSELMAGGGARLVQTFASRQTAPASFALAIINTRDGPLRAIRLSRTASAAPPGPNVISRRAWGADESIRSGQPEFRPVGKIFLHHTVTPNNADPAATIRAMYAYHVQVRGWGDIGYNFLVDSRGRVYEGRYSRQYASGETPSGEDGSGRGVVGAHTEGHNHGSTGIALLGNAQTAAPTAAAVDSLVNLIAWKAGRAGIDPAGNGPIAGSGSFPNVAGHRESPGASTECPGARLHSMLPSIRQRAQQIVDSSRPKPTGGPLGGILEPILKLPLPSSGDPLSGLLKGLGL